MVGNTNSCPKGNDIQVIEDGTYKIRAVCCGYVNTAKSAIVFSLPINAYGKSVTITADTDADYDYFMQNGNNISPVKSSSANGVDPATLNKNCSFTASDIGYTGFCVTAAVTNSDGKWYISKSTTESTGKSAIALDVYLAITIKSA